MPHDKAERATPLSNSNAVCYERASRPRSIVVGGCNRDAVRSEHRYISGMTNEAEFKNMTIAELAGDFGAHSQELA